MKQTVLYVYVYMMKESARGLRYPLNVTRLAEKS